MSSASEQLNTSLAAVRVAVPLLASLVNDSGVTLLLLLIDRICEFFVELIAAVAAYKICIDRLVIDHPLRCSRAVGRGAGRWF